MAKSHVKKLASASFFCGLGSLVLLVLARVLTEILGLPVINLGIPTIILGIILGIPAIIFGYRSNRIAKIQGRPRSKLAVTGIVLGYLSFVTTILVALNVLGIFRGKKAFSRYLVAVAQTDTTNLVEAIQAYRREYSVLPLLIEDQPHDTTTSALIDVLIGNNPRENSRSMVFLSPDRGNFRVPPSGSGAALTDPWGNPYFVAMDTDSDGSIDDPIAAGRRLRGHLAIAWCAGPDGKIHAGDENHPDNEDNIYSWRK